MFHPQSQNHLALPQRNRIHQRGLNLFHHHGIIALNQTNLRSRLHGDGLGQLQIMKLLLKAVTHGIQISCCLRILCQTGLFCLLQKFLQLCGTYLCQLLLTCQHIHGQFFEISKIQFIHLVQKRNILHQQDLMILQHLADLVYIRLCLRIFCLHGCHFIRSLFKQSAESFFLFLVKVFQLFDHTGQQIPDFSHIFGLYIFQSCL